MPAPQARYWLLTIPYQNFTPYLPPQAQYIKGQLEEGAHTNYLHWQLIVYYPKRVSLSYLKLIFGNEAHIEKSRSTAAEAYVWKEDTAIAGTQFEIGEKSFQRNSSKDWDLIVSDIRQGKFESLPGDVLVRCYSNIKKIRVDSLVPEPIVREIYVYWGRSGTGKSRRAWDEAGFNAFPKDPNSKFWDGYTGQTNVVMDEYRGTIAISHLLRWFDRYPVIVEVKGSSCVFKAQKIWITSNISPDDWYPDLDAETKAALRRRFTCVVHYN